MRSETVADRELVDPLPAAARWGCDAATTASDGRTDGRRAHAPAAAAVTPAVKTSFQRQQQQQQQKQPGARVSRPHAASPKVAVVLAAKGRIAAAT